MKKIIFGFVILGLSSLILLADFSEPFTDSPADSSVKNQGWLISGPDGKSDFKVVVITDAGERILPATVSANLDVSSFLGRYVTITATIRQKEKLRSLEITDIKMVGRM
jgi:hypothetical protein